MIATSCLNAAEQGRPPRAEASATRGGGLSRIVVGLLLVCAFVGRPSGAPPSNVDGRWTERESLGTTRDARASGGTAERDAESPYRQGGPRPDAVTMLRLRSTRGAPSSIHARRSRFDPRAAVPLRSTRGGPASKRCFVPQALGFAGASWVLSTASTNAVSAFARDAKTSDPSRSNLVYADDPDPDPKTLQGASALKYDGVNWGT